VKKMILALGACLLVTTGHSHLHFGVTPKVVHPLPPSFITLRDIPECNPDESFPQTSLLPHFTEAHQIQYSCDFYDKDHVAWVMILFLEEWSKNFPDTYEIVENSLNALTIEWGKNSKNVKHVFDINGVLFENSQVVGLMESDTEIWVMSEPKLSSTSLVHELVHIALAHACGGADPDHEGDIYPCWSETHTKLIKKVNQRALSFGL